MNSLRKEISDLIIINQAIILNPQLKVPYHWFISKLHSLMLDIEECEKEFSSLEIMNELKELRAIHAKSPFVKRLQDWPLGYQGDFETIEYLCQCKNKCQPNTLEYFIEDYALNSFIAQQHRNKVEIQSRAILYTITNTYNPKILIVGCGSGIDVRNVQHAIKQFDFEIVFNDMDLKALDFTKSKLNHKIVNQSKFIEKNIIQYTRDIVSTSEKFDLILFGGVFDYLTDKQIKFVLSNIYKHNLNENGKIIFTNIRELNPFRVWIEYLANWTLLERSESKNIELCKNAQIPNENINQYPEKTGLTNIVEIVKS